MLLGLWDYLRGPVTDADIDEELRPDAALAQALALHCRLTACQTSECFIRQRRATRREARNSATAVILAEDDSQYIDSGLPPHDSVFDGVHTERPDDHAVAESRSRSSPFVVRSVAFCTNATARLWRFAAVSSARADR